MKIFISEEDKVGNRFQFGGLEYRCSELDIQIHSLEQQNKEVLKEFADKLKNEIENNTYILTNLNINETYMGSKVTKQELFNLIIFDLLKERGVE